MKNILTILALAFASITAQAQFVQGGAVYNAWTNSVFTNALKIAGATATNIPTTAARVIPIGNNTTTIYVRVAGTSGGAAGGWMLWETSCDGSNWNNQANQLVSFTYTNAGSGEGIMSTNIPIAQFNAANFGGANLMRLKTISNSTAATINYYTNIGVVVR
jgi:hypothetical protein